MRSEDILRKRLVTEAVTSKMLDAVRIRLLLVNVHLFSVVIEMQAMFEARKKEKKESLNRFLAINLISQYVHKKKRQLESSFIVVRPVEQSTETFQVKRSAIVLTRDATCLFAAFVRQKVHIDAANCVARFFEKSRMQTQLYELMRILRQRVIRLQTAYRKMKAYKNTSVFIYADLMQQCVREINVASSKHSMPSIQI